MLLDRLDFTEGLEVPHTRSFLWRYCHNVIRYLCITLAQGLALLWWRTPFRTDNEHH